MQPTTESRAAAAAEPLDRRTGTRIARASCLPVGAALAAALVLFVGALYAPAGLDDPAPAAELILAEAMTRPPATAVADDCPSEAEGLAADGYLLVVLREAVTTPRPRAGGHSTAATIPTI